ncbi:MAG: hypothetical protein HY301_16980 [Verrucomicrobia bacterium]|nr:hypothetical protein [Verrucomicrobiota bacterium]
MNLFELRAMLVALLAAAAVLAGIYLGSHRLEHFDPALVWYAVGSVLAVFAAAYRFSVWAQRPPSRTYFRRGLELLLRSGAPAAGDPASAAAAENQSRSFALPAGPGTLGAALASGFVAQNFIRRRGGYRWLMHLCLSGGSTLAFAITFPLVFGWVHFETLPDNAEQYRALVLGVPVDEFGIHSLKAFVAFNLLNIAAVIVLVGLVMAGVRRATDPGERATQKFFEDILPLLLIFAVTITGLALTVSYKFLAGRGHHTMAWIHMVTVVTLILYIPFGKLFHIFQRTCALAVNLYKKAGRTGPRAHCRACGEDFASQMHVDDLKLVLDQLGFDYRFATPRGRVHYQDICPACRRRLLALNQGKGLGR